MRGSAQRCRRHAAGTHGNSKRASSAAARCLALEPGPTPSLLQVGRRSRFRSRSPPCCSTPTSCRRCCAPSAGSRHGGAALRMLIRVQAHSRRRINSRALRAAARRRRHRRRRLRRRTRSPTNAPTMMVATYTLLRRTKVCSRAAGAGVGTGAAQPGPPERARGAHVVEEVAQAHGAPFPLPQVLGCFRHAPSWVGGASQGRMWA